MIESNREPTMESDKRNVAGDVPVPSPWMSIPVRGDSVVTMGAMFNVDPRAIPINPTNDSGSRHGNLMTSENPPLFHMDLSEKMGDSTRVVHKLLELCISCGLELVENNVNSALAQLRGAF